MADKDKELQKRKYEEDENPEEISSADTEADTQTTPGPPKTKVSKVEHTTVDVTEESKKEDAEKYLPPLVLNGCLPQPMKEVNLYLMAMKLEKISDDVNDLNIQIPDLDDSSTSLGILLSKDLPQIPEFPVFTTHGHVKVGLIECGRVMLSADETEKIEKLHQSLFRNMLNIAKDCLFDPSAAPMAFYIVPINKHLGSIDWPCITAMLEVDFHQLRSKLDKSANIKDILSFAVSWIPLYTPDANKFSLVMEDITKNLSKNETNREYLMQELCKNFSFSELFFEKLKIIPIALFRIHSLLIAEEIRRNVEDSIQPEKELPECKWPYFDIEKADIKPNDIKKHDGDVLSFLNPSKFTSPSPSDVVQALTLKSINDVFNLERLEVMGDCFLKYYVTVLLFCTFSSYDASKLSKLRGQIIRNENLAQKAKSKNIICHIISDRFIESAMIPPCYCTKKAITCPKKEGYYKHRNAFSFEKPLHLKTIADVTEALIGVYMLKSGQTGAIHLMKFLDLLNVQHVEEIEYKYDFKWPPPAKKIADEPICTSAEEHIKIKEFEENIHYVFKNKYLLLEATKITISQPREIEFNYDRLAFLGDSVLEFMITRNVFDEKELSQVELHEKKVYLINKDYKGLIAIKHELYLFIKDTKVQELVSKFKESKPFEFFLDHGYLEDTEESAEIDLPRALGNIFNAVVGAVYLDADMDLTTTWKVLSPMIQPAIEYLKKNPAANPVVEVIRILYKAKRDFVWYSEKDGDGVCAKIILSDKKEVEAWGRNISIAKRLAALKARDELRENNE